MTGTVTDTDGDAIPGAQVTLATAVGQTALTAHTDKDGYFSFLNVSPGPMELSVAADGFATGTEPLVLRSNQDLRIPDLALAVASANMNMEVSLSASDRAEVEVKTEEQQRLVGFVPNFYVTYDWHAPPLKARQKFELAVHSVYDPASILINAGQAGVMQATNTFSGYGSGWAAYGKRFGANTADFTVGTMLGGAIFPALLHQDPRYFYKGKGSVASRALYALSTAFVCKGDNGKWQPNYSSVLGDVGAGLVSTTYYPASDRSGTTVTMEAGLLNAASEGFGNLLQEFVYKRFTPGANKAK